MVRVSEKFLQQITELAEDGASTVDAFNSRIVNLTDPIDPQDAATKAYVDGYIEGGGTFYVDEQTGSDNNPGTISEPFATLDKALQTIGPVVSSETKIFLGPSVTSTGYSSEELKKPRTIYSTLEIIGTDTIAETDEFALTSFTLDGRVFDFSGAGVSFTPDGYIGRHIEFVSGSSGITPGTKTVITANDTDTINGSRGIFAPTTFTTPAAGDIFKISRPAASIEVLPDDEYYSAPYRDINTIDSLPIGIAFSNIEFRLDDGLDGTVYFYGSYMIDACTFTKDVSGSNDLVIRFADSSVINATRFDDDNIPTYGTVLSGYDRGGNVRFPQFWFEYSFFDGGICGGQTRFIDSCGGVLRHGGRFDASGLTSTFPHGCLHIGKHTHITTTVSSTLRVFFLDVERDIEIDFGMFELFVPTVHLGTGGFARARHQGQLNMGETTIVTGSGAGLRVWEGGRIRITGTDASTLGDAVAGVNTAITRSASEGAWAVGEQIVSADQSIIKRTS